MQRGATLGSTAPHGAAVLHVRLAALARRGAPLSQALLVAALALALTPAGAHAAAPPTGRLLVTLDAPPRSATATRAAAAVLAHAGLRRDGAQVPQIGLVSVRPTGGGSAVALAATLRRKPGVRAVEVERRHALRFVPNDPALTAPEVSPGTPAGTTLSWWVPRLGLPAAWDVTRGDGATVAVIDTGVDAGHPDLAGKIVQTFDDDATSGHAGPTVDENGHGTHVASLACGAGDNAFGIVGSGMNCRLIVIKSDLSDGSVARSIVQAADAGADVINMSFGTDGQLAAAHAIIDAIDYAVEKDVVLVAAAADSPVEEQGDPANLLQPTGTGGDITAGRGLSVTAADASGERASFSGRGSQISLAAYGSFAAGQGPHGIFADFPANPTELENAGSVLFPQPGCQCRSTFLGDARFAYLEGTSMATPIVAGIAALASQANPEATAADIVRVLKQTATRPAGSGWSPELGWGIVDAGAAMAAIRALDRSAPRSKLNGPARVRSARSLTLRWKGRDTVVVGQQSSGIDHFDVYRSTDRGPYRRIKRTSARQMKVAVRPGSRYRFYTIAVDRAGNREAVPPRPDLSTRVDARR